MSDLISRQAVLEELEKGAWGKDWDKALAIEMVKSVPSEELVSLTTKCKDCKYFVVHTFCDRSLAGSMHVEPHDYCSNAERREESKIKEVQEQELDEEFGINRLLARLSGKGGEK